MRTIILRRNTGLNKIQMFEGPDFKNVTLN